MFHREHARGSQRAYDPLGNAAQYVLDSAQVESFETRDYGRGLRDVVRHLGSPAHVIEREGGWRTFVNTEVFPIDREQLADSKAALPNYALHLLGGGLVFRKDAEWLHAHGVPAPYLVAGSMAMAAEVLAEAIEKPAADDTDEIADVFVFRPLGLLLYGNETSARWIHRHLAPVDWPYQLVWDADDERLRNIGMSYVFRPSLLATESTRFFAHTGMTNLFGLSHALPGGDTFSWGAGAATESIDPVELRWSGGVFWEHDDSLLASLIVHGAEGYAVRANVYPGVLADADTFWGAFGWFVGVTDDGEAVAGVQWRLPIGIGG